MLTLRRIISGPDGTFGVLMRDNTPILCTLEPETPIIPEGVYTLTKYESPKFGREVFLINNVPGHDAVEMHVGNTVKDTAGCILVGMNFIYSGSGISNSQIALENLLSDMPDKTLLHVIC